MTNSRSIQRYRLLSLIRSVLIGIIVFEVLVIAVVVLAELGAAELAFIATVSFATAYFVYCWRIARLYGGRYSNGQHLTTWYVGPSSYVLAAPLEPVGPLGQVVPGEREEPLAPVTPLVRPVAPEEPDVPLAPVTPLVRPVAPEEPFAPLAPVAPAVPLAPFRRGGQPATAWTTKATPEAAGNPGASRSNWVPDSLASGASPPLVGSRPVRAAR